MLAIKAQKLNHRADTRMPNALSLKTLEYLLESTAPWHCEAVSSWVSATGGRRTQTFLLHQGLPKNLWPGCAAPSGSIRSPFVSLSAPSFVLTRGAAPGPPSAARPRSLPRVCRPPPLVPARCIILYMMPGCPRCSVLTAVFPSVYINPSKHSRARECSVYVSYTDCHTNGFYNYSYFVVDFQAFLFILYQIYLYIL